MRPECGINRAADGKTSPLARTSVPPQGLGVAADFLSRTIHVAQTYCCSLDCDVNSLHPRHPCLASRGFDAMMYVISLAIYKDRTSNINFSVSWSSSSSRASCSQSSHCSSSLSLSLRRRRLLSRLAARSSVHCPSSLLIVIRSERRSRHRSGRSLARLLSPGSSVSCSSTPASLAGKPRKWSPP